jgi:hypothetical protein
MQEKFNPIVSGPGIWYVIHNMAANNTKNAPEKKMFVDFIYKLCETFKCGECKVHFETYLKKFPPELYISNMHPIFGDIGCFEWSWSFHNHVNDFLKKNKPSLEEAYRFYKNDTGVCNEKHASKPSGTKAISFAVPEIISQYRSGQVKAKEFY